MIVAPRNVSTARAGILTVLAAMTAVKVIALRTAITRNPHIGTPATF